MFAVIGIFVVIACVIGGYLWHKGNLSVLWQPSEFLIIGGAALGAFIISTPLKTIKATIADVIGIFSGGTSYNTNDYTELLMLLNGIFYKIRQQGLVSIEADVDAPKQSALFGKYPKILKNKHAVELITDTLRTVMTTTIAAHELESLIDTELESYLEEVLQPSKSVNYTADALPALGIVAAVLGVIITMGKMKEPPDVLGQSVAAALVGTFLGVLLSYGFVGPLGRNLEYSAHEKLQYLVVIKVALVSFLGGSAPKVAIEFGRRVVPADMRPSFAAVEEAIKKRK